MPIRHKPLYNQSRWTKLYKHIVYFFPAFLDCIVDIVMLCDIISTSYRNLSLFIPCRFFYHLHLNVVWYRINNAQTLFCTIVHIVEIAILDGVQLTFCIFFTYYRCLNIVSLLCISIDIAMFDQTVSTSVSASCTSRDECGFDVYKY